MNSSFSSLPWSLRDYMGVPIDLFCRDEKIKEKMTGRSISHGGSLQPAAAGMRSSP
jgi:hypothetical protein